MGLKITTPIGTDKGITSEAYVRIADYQVSKHGHANFRIELYQTQEDSVNNNGMHYMGGQQARNQQIGENFGVSLSSQVEATRTITTLIDGVESTREEKYQKTVVDLSPLEDSSIFAFGYSHLKIKLIELFGAKNVLDC